MSRSKAERVNRVPRAVSPAVGLDNFLADIVRTGFFGEEIDEEARRRRSRDLTADPAAEGFRQARAAEAAARSEKTARLRAARIARDAARLPASGEPFRA